MNLPMPPQPVIEARQLRLRPFVAADAPEVQRLAGDRRVAETTLAIPHPYPDGAAEAWIATHPVGWLAGREISYAIERRRDAALVGAIALLNVSAAHAHAEVGYWIGHEHWGQGYATEATRALLDFAENELGLTRFAGRCLARNPASARVMQKAGLRPEGCLVRHLEIGGVYEDVLLFGRVAPSRLAP
jgi:RimJ/RimL family protein N-acetyltransferase